MAKYYEGKQATMRDVTIRNLHGYLGPFESILKVGDYQKMNFQENDVGPFWMSPEEQHETKNDEAAGKIKNGSTT
jgi:hypothetical protein